MEYQFNEQTFEQDVLQSDIPVLVDFFAQWCGPCKMMAPNIEKLAADYEGKIKVGKLDIDENINIISNYHITSVPTLILFKNGEAAAKSIGFMSYKELEKFINQ